MSRLPAHSQAHGWGISQDHSDARAAARRSGPPAPERGDLVVTGKPDLEWRDPAPEDSMDIQSIATLPDGERIGEVYQLVSPDEADDVSAAPAAS